MIELFETIKIEDGKVANIEYHQKRFDYSRLKLFGSQKPLYLQDLISFDKKGLYRCRVTYSDKIESVEYEEYTPKEFTNFKIVSANIDYAFKYKNRDVLTRAKESYRDFDEIIIEKGGLLSDTTLANIAFFDGTQWITPKTPLLKGTTRARLIDTGYLLEQDIRSDMLNGFSKFALLNAMLDFKEIKDYNIQK